MNPNTATYAFGAPRRSCSSRRSPSPSRPARPPRAPRSRRQRANLAPTKTYLLKHTAKLRGFTTRFQREANRYYALAKASDFDYAALWASKRSAVRPILARAKALWIEGNPYYERVEGVVAGTPSLAVYDVILDAGSSAKEDPASAVPFDLKLADGRVLAQAREPLQPHRGHALGHAARVHGEGRQGRPRRRRQGRVRRGAARTRRCSRPPPTRSRSTPAKLDRSAQRVEADRVGRLHGGRRDGADDERVLRPVEGVALRARRPRARATRSTSSRGSPTSATSSAACASSTRASSRRSRRSTSSRRPRRSASSTACGRSSPSCGSRRRRDALHARAGRLARPDGAGARDGDRRPGDAGRGPAQGQDRAVAVVRARRGSRGGGPRARRFGDRGRPARRGRLAGDAELALSDAQAALVLGDEAAAERAGRRRRGRRREACSARHPARSRRDERRSAAPRRAVARGDEPALAAARARSGRRSSRRRHSRGEPRGRAGRRRRGAQLAPRPGVPAADAVLARRRGRDGRARRARRGLRRAARRGSGRAPRPPRHVRLATADGARRAARRRRARVRRDARGDGRARARLLVDPRAASIAPSDGARAERAADARVRAARSRCGRRTPPRRRSATIERALAASAPRRSRTTSSARAPGSSSASCGSCRSSTAAA